MGKCGCPTGLLFWNHRGSLSFNSHGCRACHVVYTLGFGSSAGGGGVRLAAMGAQKVLVPIAPGCRCRSLLDCTAWGWSASVYSSGVTAQKVQAKNIDGKMHTSSALTLMVSVCKKWCPGTCWPGGSRIHSSPFPAVMSVPGAAAR